MADNLAKTRETVIIGCKLPNGLLLEIGYSTTARGEGNGSLKVELVKHPDYASYQIKGWNAHTEEMRNTLIKAGSDTGLPHGLNTTPYLNRGVPKAFWERWVAEHKRSWLIKNQVLFVANDDKSAASLVAESKDTPKVFEPIDRNKKIVPGIKTADFMLERGNAKGEIDGLADE
jgi:hypothetical protein